MAHAAACAVALRTFWELELHDALPKRCRASTDGCLELRIEPPADASEPSCGSSLHSPRSDQSPSECSFHGATSRASTASTADEPEALCEVKLPRAVKVAECLRELDAHDAECILRVTRLSRAGRTAVELLRSHLETRFGAVERILEVHPPHLSRNIKVSNMVYVVMRSREAARSVLAAGSDHDIFEGAMVLVRSFERRRTV